MLYFLVTLSPNLYFTPNQWFQGVSRLTVPSLGRTVPLESILLLPPVWELATSSSLVMVKHSLPCIFPETSYLIGEYFDTHIPFPPDRVIFYPSEYFPYFKNFLQTHLRPLSLRFKKLKLMKHYLRFTLT